MRVRRTAPVGAEDKDPDVVVIELELEALEANLFDSLPGELERVLADPKSNARVIDRLFPRAHKDEEEERKHRALLGASMFDERRELCAAITSSLAAASETLVGDKTLSLTAADADRWMRFVNDLRLVIATELGIERSVPGAQQARPEPPDPSAARYALFDYLGGFEYVLVEALMATPREPEGPAGSGDE